MTTEAPRKSKLILVGLLFLLASLFLPGSFQTELLTKEGL